MSPEQAKGQPADQRSDIYAVGMIMLDMLVGMRAVENPTDAMNELMERVEHAPKPVRDIDGTIPEAVDSIVTKCLQVDPAARYQTVAELFGDLNKLDENGEPLPILRQFSQRAMAAIGLLVVALLGGTWYLARGPGVPVEIAPVSVLIADFDNQTGDPVFEGALEQALAIAMEGASFVRVFPQQSARRVAAQTVPNFSGKIDPAVGQLISRREGVKVLLAGGIARDGSRYRLSLKATDPATGADITTADREVDNKTDVLGAVAHMAEDVRAELGESRSDMEKVAAAETFTAASLDAMREYARGQAQLNAGNYQDALGAYEAALKYDPQLGRAHASIGTIYVNLKQLGKADTSFKQALKLLDRMTPRERYRTQAGYFLGVAGNTDKAIENYEALIKEFPADDVAYGNLALAYLRAMNVPKAKEVAAKGLQLYPNNLLQRTNYSAYALYAADFDTAIREGQVVLKANEKYEFPYLPIALSYAATQRFPEAEATYQRLGSLSPTGAALAALGLADLDMFRGLSAAAIAKLREGIAVDQKTQNTGEMAIKETALAEATLATGRKTQAAAMAKRALQHGGAVNVQVASALVLIEAGDTAAALAVAKGLENRLQNETTGYARFIQGVVALSRNEMLAATEALAESVKRHDSWLARYYRGHAYFAAGNHAAEAAEEWERCYRRRGETADLFFMDSPTLRHLPPMLYWLGRAREALGTTESAQAAYREYVKIRGEAAGDRLIADARRRVERSKP
jgi:tetratricopeptide (TPR) repeat protein